VPHLVSLTRKRTVFQPLQLDRSWSVGNGVNPLGGTNYLDTVSAFIRGFLHLLAGEGVWGRGRHLSRFPLYLAKMLSGANAFRISGYKLKPEDRMLFPVCDPVCCFVAVEFITRGR
jgi:hypothetical protein